MDKFEKCDLSSPKESDGMVNETVFADFYYLDLTFIESDEKKTNRFDQDCDKEKSVQDALQILNLDQLDVSLPPEEEDEDKDENITVMDLGNHLQESEHQNKGNSGSVDKSHLSLPFGEISAEFLENNLVDHSGIDSDISEHEAESQANAELTETESTEVQGANADIMPFVLELPPNQAECGNKHDIPGVSDDCLVKEATSPSRPSISPAKSNKSRFSEDFCFTLYCGAKYQQQQPQMLQQPSSVPVDMIETNPQPPPSPSTQSPSMSIEPSSATEQPILSMSSTRYMSSTNSLENTSSHSADIIDSLENEAPSEVTSNILVQEMVVEDSLQDSIQFEQLESSVATISISETSTYGVVRALIDKVSEASFGPTMLVTSLEDEFTLPDENKENEPPTELFMVPTEPASEMIETVSHFIVYSSDSEQSSEENESMGQEQEENDEEKCCFVIDNGMDSTVQLSENFVDITLDTRKSLLPENTEMVTDQTSMEQNQSSIQDQSLTTSVDDQNETLSNVSAPLVNIPEPVEMIEDANMSKITPDLEQKPPVLEDSEEKDGEALPKPFDMTFGSMVIPSINIMDASYQPELPEDHDQFGGKAIGDVSINLMEMTFAPKSPFQNKDIVLKRSSEKVQPLHSAEEYSYLDGEENINEMSINLMEMTLAAKSPHHKESLKESSEKVEPLSSVEEPADLNDAENVNDESINLIDMTFMPRSSRKRKPLCSIVEEAEADQDSSLHLIDISQGSLLGSVDKASNSFLEISAQENLLRNVGESGKKKKSGTPIKLIDITIGPNINSSFKDSDCTPSNKNPKKACRREQGKENEAPLNLIDMTFGTFANTLEHTPESEHTLKPRNESGSTLTGRKTSKKPKKSVSFVDSIICEKTPSTVRKTPFRSSNSSASRGIVKQPDIYSPQSPCIVASPISIRKTPSDTKSQSSSRSYLKGTISSGNKSKSPSSLTRIQQSASKTPSSSIKKKSQTPLNTPFSSMIERFEHLQLETPSVNRSPARRSSLTSSPSPSPPSNQVRLQSTLFRSPKLRPLSTKIPPIQTLLSQQPDGFRTPSSLAGPKQQYRSKIPISTASRIPAPRINANANRKLVNYSVSTPMHG